MQTLKTILYIFGILIIVKLALAVIGGATTVATTPAPAVHPALVEVQKQKLCHDTTELALTFVRLRNLGVSQQEAAAKLVLPSTYRREDALALMHGVYADSSITKEDIQERTFDACLADLHRG